jgi:NADPH:quinone reductase-like Zn-dependent oxidoreductase
LFENSELENQEFDNREMKNKGMSPLISTTFPLEKAVDAHKLMESNQHMGKIVLTNN